MKRDHHFALLFLVLSLTLLQDNAIAVSPDIKANGVDEPIAITSGDNLTIQVSLSSGDQLGENADWWGAALFSDTWSSYKPAEGWLSGLDTSYQGPLFDFPLFSILDSSGLSVGSHTFYFGIDTVMNGQLDLVQLSYDSVEVHRYLSAAEVSDGDTYVDIYDPSKACNGTTLLSDTQDSQNPKILEIDMLGQVVWEYDIPNNLRSGNLIGLDVELLSNGNILFNLSNGGLYEIDRNGDIQWSYEELNNSHDADRLSNGNTLYVFGNDDTQDDAQAREIDSDGNLVWEWKAIDHYSTQDYLNIERQGWTHINGITRLSNGNTLLSLRNFDLTVEVDSSGTPVWSVDWRDYGGSTTDPHEPEIQSNGNLLVCMQRSSPYRALEINRSTEAIVWSYSDNDMRTARDCDRLPNGNTLILAVLENGTEDDLSDDESVIIEVTPSGEIVWRLKLKNILLGESPGVFYKAERHCS